MYTGSAHSISIGIDFNLLCDQFYYGAKCEVFCQPHNDTRGHYTCDEQGNIVCNRGYTGEQTNCTTGVNSFKLTTIISITTPTRPSDTFKPHITSSVIASIQSTVSTSSNFNIIIAVIISAFIIVVVQLITTLIIGIICCKLYHRETFTTTDQDIPVENNVAYHINKEWTTAGIKPQAIDELYDE